MSDAAHLQSGSHRAAQTCPILALPRELLLEILKYVLQPIDLAAQYKDHTWYRINNAAPTRVKDYPVAILRTCRSLYDIAIEEVYSQAKFHVQLMPLEDVKYWNKETTKARLAGDETRCEVGHDFATISRLWPAMSRIKHLRLNVRFATDESLSEEENRTVVDLASMDNVQTCTLRLEQTIIYYDECAYDELEGAYSGSLNDACNWAIQDLHENKIPLVACGLPSGLDLSVLGRITKKDIKMAGYLGRNATVEVELKRGD